MKAPEIGFIEIIYAIGLSIPLIAGLSWAAKYKGKFMNPYRLRSASKKEKTHWAFRYISMIIGIFLVPILISWLAIFLYQKDFITQSGGTIEIIALFFQIILFLAFIFIVMVAVEYVKIENTLSNYLRWDKEKKRNRLTKSWLFANTGWMSSEVREHFWKYGYSKDYIADIGEDTGK